MTVPHAAIASALYICFLSPLFILESIGPIFAKDVYLVCISVWLPPWQPLVFLVLCTTFMMTSQFPFWAHFPPLNLTFLSFFPYSLCLFPSFFTLIYLLLTYSSVPLLLFLYLFPVLPFFVDAFELLHSLGATLQVSFIVS